jgi:hypothetical protein
LAFQGSLRELPLPDVIQLVAVSGKTGAFGLKNGPESGRIFLRRGQIVHATAGTLVGEQAVYELARWSQGEFNFTPEAETETVSIEKSNTNLLMEAARQIDEWKILSKKIGSTRMIPVFAPQASRVSVSFTPPEWAVITKVDERRSIDEIAAGLGLGAFEVCKVIYGLLTSGVLALHEDLRHLPLDRLREVSAGEQASIADQIHRVAQGLLAGGEWSAELDAALRLCRAEMEAGRGADAILDLVRSDEKLVSAHAGPNQAKSFLERVAVILRST